MTAPRWQADKRRRKRQQCHQAAGFPDIERNLSNPNVARVYDCLLGGHDHYAADRELASEIERLCPEAREIARGNREFLARAVTWAAGRTSPSSST